MVTVRKLAQDTYQSTHLPITMIRSSTEHSQVNQVFHYATNWKEGKVNQMWIEEIEETEDAYQYVAVAYNPENEQSMVMSNPRGYYDTLQWVAKFCGSFCILPQVECP